MTLDLTGITSKVALHQLFKAKPGFALKTGTTRAGSLNIEKLARVLVDDGDEVEDTAA